MPEKYEGSSFADIAMDYRRTGKIFTDKVDELLDFTKIDRKLKKKYTRNVSADGRPAYPPLVLFKSLLLQSWYGLSDYELEEALYDRLSFVRFTGLSLEDSVPDHSTICRFRNELLLLNLYEKLFAEIMSQLERKGLFVKKGVIVDATVVESSRRPRRVIEELPEDRLEEDQPDSTHKITYSSDEDAKWLKKGKRAYYGYKVHAGVDSEYGYILGGHVTGANVADSVELEQTVSDCDLTPAAAVYCDKGYSSRSNRDFLTTTGCVDMIMSKAARGRALSECQQLRNRHISSLRYKVERGFGTLKRDYGFARMRYVGIAKAGMEFLLKAMAFNIKKAVLQTF